MMESLTTAQFKSKVFDYDANQEWRYEGSLPAIVDFWAEWCPPCKMVAPILEELSKTYEGKVHIYKVNTDEESDLATAFGVQSIPSLLFVPVGDKPQISVGTLPRPSLVKAIKDILKVE